MLWNRTVNALCHRRFVWCFFVLFHLLYLLISYSRFFLFCNGLNQFELPVLRFFLTLLCVFMCSLTIYMHTAKNIPCFPDNLPRDPCWTPQPSLDTNLAIFFHPDNHRKIHTTRLRMLLFRLFFVAPVSPVPNAPIRTHIHLTIGLEHQKWGCGVCSPYMI